MEDSQPASRVRLPVTARRSREVEPSFAPIAPSGPSGSDGDDVGPLHLFAIFWHHRLLVLACVALSLGAAVLYLTRATHVYGASSTIYVQHSGSKVLGEDYSSGDSTTANYLATQCQLITSTVILSDAVQLLPGADDGTSIFHTDENLVGILKECVSAAPSKQGDLIVVSAEALNPKNAAAIVNCVVQAYITYQSKQHQSTAVQVAGILQKEMDTHEAELASAQARMLSLKVENPDLSFRTSKDGQPITRMGELMQQMSAAQFRAADLRRAARAADGCPDDPVRLERIAEQHGIGVTSVPSSAGLASLCQQQEMTLNALLAAHLGPANDRVQQAQFQLGQTRDLLAAATRGAAAAYHDSIRSASETADTQVAEMKAEIDAERSASTALNAKAAEYQQLQQTAERNERALDVLDGRIKEIRVTEDVGPMSTTVLEVAKINPVPVSPVKSKILGEALVGGLMVSLALSFLLDKLDQRLRTVAEVTTLLDAPVLGVVPRVQWKGQVVQVGLEVALRPRSGTAEAFRTIRTAIAFGGYDRSVKTILVTSPAAGDGKSVCVSNLAIAVAQAGRRTLLIDADCRRPVQHKLFGIVDVGPGLSGVLSGTATLAEATRPTEIDRLDVLPCGPLPHNPAELLDSQPMLDLLAEVGRHYDQVLIDSPPVTLVSDARVLAAVCDASILVLRSERSTRHVARLAWNALSSVGAHLVGTIINDVQRSRDGYGYGYNYYGYGRYGTTPPVNGTANGVADGTASGAVNGAVHGTPAGLRLSAPRADEPVPASGADGE